MFCLLIYCMLLLVVVTFISLLCVPATSREEMMFETLHFISATLKEYWSQIKDTDSSEGESQGLALPVRQY